ncbi:cysteine desulfurase [Blastopirellula sp. JC732]|uniref:Probable cysteine desulfurase n=1 Tax=Blastopirellula sediminis TaxID=2894196 RepID=A0A9X1MNY4_9BACT|nr:cysteine desulfurase [Blastopirellula sediminis]MCC9606657.1 cysteine desulfurase [Blastopirellula sediminis]MCC9630046.1 cysteine desulfurase [Blastopirellula sediminis]
MTVASQQTENLDVDAIRADFPILHQTVHGKPLVYLDNAASSQKPRQVIDALREVDERYYANVHRGGHQLSNEATSMYEESREAARRFLGAKSNKEVIFTYGTTSSINTVAHAWGVANLAAGDEILVSEMEHHSNLVPWQQVAARTGAKIKALPITPDGLLAMDELPAMLSERTKIVAVTAASNVLGTINPVEKIIRQAHAVGAVVSVDAAQAAPHKPINVVEWGADFVALSAHKMLGPSGVGILYGKQELLDAMPPFLGGGSMINTVTIEGFTPAMLPAKFEAGTPPITAAIALKAAIEYLENIGLANILAHEQMLAEYAHQLMADIPGLKILGPDPQQKAGIVSFTVNGVSPNDIGMMIDTAGVAIRAGHHCAMPLHAKYGISSSARASFYVYNTREEVETFVAALRKVLAILA